MLHLRYSYNVIVYLMQNGGRYVMEPYRFDAWVIRPILHHTSPLLGKTIPVTGHGRPQGFETPKLRYFLDNQLTDGGEVVSLTLRPPFTPQQDSSYSFLLEAESNARP
jgi:hypothetical protein